MAIGYSMKHVGYLKSQAIAAQFPDTDEDWYACLFAAFRKADSRNAEIFAREFSQEWAEFRARYNAPLGVIPSDGYTAEEWHEYHSTKRCPECGSADVNFVGGPRQESMHTFVYFEEWECCESDCGHTWDVEVN